MAFNGLVSIYLVEQVFLWAKSTPNQQGAACRPVVERNCGASRAPFGGHGVLGFRV